MSVIIYNVVSSLIMTPDDQVLLVRQKRWDRAANPSANPEDDMVWTFPGGKMDPGETREQALVREIKEETGLDIDLQAISYIGNCRHVRPVRHSSADVHLYLVKGWSGDINVDDPCQAVNEARFFPLPEALKKIAENPWLSIREPLTDYLNGDHKTKLWTYAFVDDMICERVDTTEFQERFGSYFELKAV